MVRPAKLTDCWPILDLVNTPDVKFWSGRKHDVDPNDHADWMGRVIASPRHYMVVCENHRTDEFLGYGRLEYVTEARVSFAVKSEARGQGRGREILSALGNHANGTPLVAYVHPSNVPSMRAFLAQGYSLGEMRTEKGVMWQTLVK